MEYVIAKAINTTLYRFRIGDSVLETQDLSPHTFADLKEREFIVAKPPAFAEYVAPSPHFNRPIRTEE